MRIKILCLSVLLIFLLSCATSERKQAKIYESGLEPMVEKDSEEVVSKITATWNFKLANRWDTEDPTVESVLRRSKGRTAFTRQEANQIFSQKGKYEIMLFSKFLRKESGSTGTITEGGVTAILMGEKQEYERNAYIRVVFKDGKLLHFKVWPGL
jgi:hypothetical protein